MRGWLFLLLFSPACAQIPGIIVLSPVSLNPESHLQLSAVFVPTRSIPRGSQLVATAALPTGESVTLREFYPQSVDSVADRPFSYPLTGFGLPVGALPFGSVVTAYLNPPIGHIGMNLPAITRTASLITGMRQTPDAMIIYATSTAFNASVYFDLSPIPIPADAMTVKSDSIVMARSKIHWNQDFHTITYCARTLCDSILFPYR